MVFRLLARIRAFQFRHWAALGLMAVAFLFLAINSQILARGAARWAVSDWDKVSYALIAATVPWVIAIMPFLLAATWKSGRLTGRPTVWTIVIASVWAIFVAYNLLGAGGAISLTRTDVVSQRKHDAAKDKDASKRRQFISAQMEAIPPSIRPAAQVNGLIQVERAKPWWGYTDGCKNPSNGRERRYCGDIAKLTAELGAAQQREKLDSEIKMLDDQRAVAGWVAEIVDPAARFWSAMTGLPEETVQVWLPVATPIVLEVGSMTFMAFSLLLWGMTGHKDALSFGQRSPPQSALAATAAAGRLPYAQAMPAAAVPAQLKYEPPQLAKWFFAEHTRPGVSGGIEESIWYAQYSNVCAHYGTLALPLEQFRSIARKCGAMIIEVDGVVTYKGVMPAQPRHVA